jgi:DNA repair exonuclease SbcCD ATPase subunit
MIVFKTLTFQNFLSVGNYPVTIELDKSKTTLVHGTNGSGKSTILDVLTYALYNKPFRRVNLPQLLNSQNKKGLLTEVVFSIGKDEYIVTRGMKPKVFTIQKNGEELDSKAADKDNQQHLEQNILKLTYKSFCQVVILGSSNYIPFMQLPSAGRRECVEDFLDIKVFSTMSVLAKDRLRGVKESLTFLKNDMSTLMYKIEVQQDRIKELNVRQDDDTKELEGIIDSRSEEIDKKLKLIESVQTHEQGVRELYQQVMKKKPDQKLREFQKIITKFETKIERLAKDTQFFATNDNCPTCNQTIGGDLKQKIEQSNSKEATKLSNACQEAVDHMAEFEGDMRVAKSRQDHIDSLQKSIFQYETEVRALEKEVKVAKDKLDSLQIDTSSIDKEEGKLEVLKDQAKDMKGRYDKLTSDVRDYEMVVSLLKDSGIKAQIVKKYLPVMNKCIRNYLQQLDLSIHFTLDEEFNESVSSPLHQNFSYASFSEGQKARIDLALMLTWREVGKMKNSVTTNLLMLDEVFSSSLDEVGKECLLTILRYGLDDKQRVVVVDHTLSEAFKDKFDRSIEVTRTKGFSRYN